MLIHVAAVVHDTEIPDRVVAVVQILMVHDAAHLTVIATELQD